MYKLTCENCINCLPQPLVQGYRTADGPTLKVALYLLSGGSADEAEGALGLPTETVERALAYWVGKGLLTQCDDAAGEENTLNPQIESKPADTATIKKRQKISAKRASEISLYDKNVAALLQEAQSIIGRELDSAESFMLLDTYDGEGVPVDEILTAMAYCVGRCKNQRSVIKMSVRTVTSWWDDGIHGGEAAAEHVRLLELRESREREVATVLSIPCEDITRSQRNIIAKWYEELGYSAAFVKEALARSGKNDIRYINAMLKDWHKKGYRTIKDTYAESSTAPVVASPARASTGSAFERALARRDAEMQPTEEEK